MNNVVAKDWLEISRLLESHHALFSEMWHMGTPSLTDDIPTAAVRFVEGRLLEFVFNPDYWESLTNYERAFVISHECLHVILNHGVRAIDNDDKPRTNIALDLPVNHLLISSFGFDRNQIRDAETLCWVDTVFKDHPKLADIPTNESFEYYYQLIDPSMKIEVYVIDDHSKLTKEMKELVDKLDERLSPEEKETLKDIVYKHFEQEGKAKAGKGTGGWTFANVGHVAKKKKWETVIKNWSLKFLRDEIDSKEQWARLARRFSLLPKQIILPSEMEDDTKEKGKMPVMFFMDTSGSCYSLKDRFFTAALSLPTQRFQVRLFCFDEDVKETTLESKKVYGGGGTSFKIIEEHIQSIIQKEGIEYPEAVFIITDGAGDEVKPAKPEKWYWFLTPYSNKGLVPQKSKIFELKDFE